MRAAMLGGLVAVAAGCGRGEQPASDRAAERPRVEIVAPATGDTVSLPVTIRLAVYGATVVPADGLREEGRGHHHLLVNVDLPAPDQPIPVGDGFIHLGTGATEYVLEGLGPGPHRIIAVFAYGDHVPMASVATDTILIVVR
jgi:hypothetical protein